MVYFVLLFFRYCVLYNYEFINEDEFWFEEGDEVFVLEKCDDGWFVGIFLRMYLFGIFFGNYVEKVY